MKEDEFDDASDNRSESLDVPDKRRNVRRQYLRREEDSNYSIADIVKILKSDAIISSTLDQATNPGMPTFTISQVLAAIFAIITIVGSLVATWVGLNNQITTLKVSTDLIFNQISKDQAQANIATQEFRNKVDQNLKDISIKVETLDNTISQIYLSNVNKRPKN